MNKMGAIFLLSFLALAEGVFSSSHIYKVTFYTADESWAGTNANVKLRLHGTNGVSQVIQLPYTRSDFEKGSVDEFEVDAKKDLGDVTKVSVGHDNSGSFGGWKLNKVVVRQKNSPMSSEFVVKKWLDNSSGKKTFVSVEKKNDGNCGVTSTPRVVNGETATANQWPWQVQMRSSRGGMHICGGTLVHPQYVVTASHCVAMKSPDPKRFSLVLGEHDINKNEGKEQEFDISEIIVHEDYNDKTFNNDIAIIKLDRPAILNSNVKLACLPDQDYQLASGSKCFITGWGRLYGGGPGGQKLQQAVLPSVSNTECARVMNSVNPNGGITENMVCAGGNRKSGCHGDSGGPYVCQNANSGRFYLQGAVSWGNPYCRTSGYYTVFARVAKYFDWIQQHIYVKYISESNM